MKHRSFKTLVIFVSLFGISQNAETAQITSSDIQSHIETIHLKNGKNFAISLIPSEIINKEKETNQTAFNDPENLEIIDDDINQFLIGDSQTQIDSPPANYPETYWDEFGWEMETDTDVHLLSSTNDVPDNISDLFGDSTDTTNVDQYNKYEDVSDAMQESLRNLAINNQLNLYNDQTVNLFDDHDTDDPGISIIVESDDEPPSLRNLVNYTQKYMTTSIKSQRSRGTCAAFATTAAVESLVAKEFNFWINLSEQSAYWFGKIFSSGDYNGTSEDGLYTHEFIKKTKERGYFFQYESIWNYNPSQYREENTSSSVFDIGNSTQWIKSCKEYDGEFCKNNTHQGEPLTFMEYFYSMMDLSVATDTVPYENFGWKIKSITQLWDNEDPQQSLTNAKMYLDAGYPLVVSLYATKEFKNADATNGYVNPDDNDNNEAGGHAVLVVGFIPKSDFPDNFEAPHSKIGDGYFIVKNSWGADWGDEGYAYIPEKWASKYFYGITSFKLDLD